jgi:ubiquinone/menaquinone biosynthesis C-methylase UbiE
MNRVHNVVCSSSWWARRVEHELLPWGIGSLDLGDDVLEIGPGFGKTTRLLVDRVPRLTVLELEPQYCERLRQDLGDRVDVVQGDATALPFDDGRFSAVVCFTMLHHIPEVGLQDQVFTEAARVLRPGGTFAGTDSIGTGWLFKTIHIGDILQPIDPDGLPGRLQAAGLSDPRVSRGGRSFRFRAVAPAPA